MDPQTTLPAEKYGLLDAQLEHRIHLLRQSNIKDGDKILEIGCGQGDCTVTLAMLYPNSHITAIDPAPLTYGSPETLGQAHERIRSYDIGSRIEFVQATPTAHLSTTQEASYDVAILCHSLWYFSDREDVKATLSALRGKAKTLFIAEWALKSARREGQVHVQIALTRATCEAHIPDSDANIRSPLSPAHIMQCALESGWKRQRDSICRTSGTALQDGRWELGMLMHEDADGESEFTKRVKAHIRDDRVLVLLGSMLESVKSAVEEIGGKENVVCMDVWVGSFGDDEQT